MAKTKTFARDALFRGVMFGFAATVTSCGGTPTAPSLEPSQPVSPSSSPADAPPSGSSDAPSDEKLLVLFDDEEIEIRSVLSASAGSDWTRIAFSSRPGVKCDDQDLFDDHPGYQDDETAFNIVVANIFQEDGSRTLGISAIGFGRLYDSSPSQATLQTTGIDASTGAKSRLSVDFEVEDRDNFENTSHFLRVAGPVEAVGCGAILRREDAVELEQPKLSATWRGEPLEIRGATLTQDDDGFQNLVLATDPIACNRNPDAAVSITLTFDQGKLDSGSVDGFALDSGYGVDGEDSDLGVQHPANPPFGKPVDIALQGTGKVMVFGHDLTLTGSVSALVCDPDDF